MPSRRGRPQRQKDSSKKRCRYGRSRKVRARRSRRPADRRHIARPPRPSVRSRGEAGNRCGVRRQTGAAPETPSRGRGAGLHMNSNSGEAADCRRRADRRSTGITVRRIARGQGRPACPARSPSLSDLSGATFSLKSPASAPGLRSFGALSWQLRGWRLIGDKSSFRRSFFEAGIPGLAGFTNDTA